MSTAVTIIPQNFGPVSTHFAGVPQENDLGAGVSQGFGLIGYKGKVWSIRSRGEEHQLMREDGDGPRSSIEVVIVKASPVIGKIYYIKGYVEGSNEAPDCFSSNGITPDSSSTAKQADTCALCQHNKWGSAPTRAGQPPSKGKACADSKRYAVVPLGDIPNELYGGPLLLRVPAASMGAGADYGTMMNKLGYPYYAIGTRIQFDSKESYPKFLFSAIRPLNDEEAVQVKEMRDSVQVARVLAEDSLQAAPAQVAAPTVHTAFEQPPPAQVAQAAVPAPVARQVTPADVKPAATAVPIKPAGGGFGTTTKPRLEVVQASPPVVPPDEAPDSDEASKFEADLDAQLDALLPK